MSFGGGRSGGSTTTVQQADPWSGAQPFLQDVYGRARNAADNTSAQPYTGRFVTGAHGNQTQGATLLGQQGARNLTSGDGAISLANDTIGGKYVNNNPYLQSAIDATIRPTVNRVREELLPAIGSAAQRAGAYGGSRQAFLEARTMDDTNRAVGDTAAKMWNDNYNFERQMQNLAPQMLAAGQALNRNAATDITQSGDVLRAAADLETQNGLAAFEDDLNRYWRPINPYVAALSGVGMPGGTTSMRSNAGGSALGGAVGGAAGGAALGGMAGMAGMLAPLGLAGPGGMALGALLGGGLGMVR